MSDSLNIALIPGDGIGKEVMPEGVRVLEAAASKYGFELEWVEYDWSSLDFDGLEVWNGGNRHDQDDDSAYHGGIDLGAVTSGNLLTVYANIKDLKVKKGDSVSRGQTIAAVRGGNPSFLHFEVREGFESVDPTPYVN